MNETEHIPWVILLAVRIRTYLEYFLGGQNKGYVFLHQDYKGFLFLNTNVMVIVLPAECLFLLLIL
jgi:hypothetical protein